MITRAVQFRGKPVRHGHCDSKQQQLPSVLQQASNAAVALGRVVAAVATGKPLMRSESERQEIQAKHCVPCRHYDAKQKRCTLCGCWVRWKARLATEHCPVGLW